MRLAAGARRGARRAARPGACAVLCAILSALSGCGLFGGGSQAPTAGGGASASPAVLGVDPQRFSGGVAPADYGRGADYFSVWCGSWTDEAPAKAAAQALQRQGLTAFALKKTLEEKRIPFNRTVGDYWLLMTGLFGERADAEALGSRLKARGLVSGYQVIRADLPAETATFEAQTRPLAQRSETAQRSAQERLGQPVSPSSPSATGEAFKRAVTGRYIGSFRDEWAAKDEARRLTSAGWPAGVESATDTGGMWYRVYLTGQNQVEGGESAFASAVPEGAAASGYRVSRQSIQAAQAQGSSQKGLVLVVDTSGLKGAWGASAPNRARSDASSCAGYSQSGRLLASLERLASYIPDAGLLVSVRNLGFREEPGVFARAARSVKSWWSEDGSAYSEARPAYGPAVYNRPEVLRAVRGMKPDVRPAPLGPGLSGLSELQGIPGRKTVVLFSDFRFKDSTEGAEAAAGGLRGQYGDVDFLVVYGDSSGEGWRLAESLSRAGGGGPEAWDGCLLLTDNGYFERFVKRVFPR